jgi:hypothetical protein
MRRMTSSTSDGDKFFKRLADSLDEHSFVKLVLAKYRGPEPDLLRATLRRIRCAMPTPSASSTPTARAT